jgi:uncharacterized repeat protein (TIGR01451 family)
MKKIYFYLFASILLLSAKSEAQSITSHSVTSIDTSCTGAGIFLTTSTYSSSLFVQTYFGDGTFSWAPVMNAGSSGYIAIMHPYEVSGTYTLREVLYNGAAPVDSVTQPFTYLFCRTLPVFFYYDANSSCTYDAGDRFLQLPFVVEIDSAGIPIDTMSCTGGIFYKAYGAPGTVYSFKVVNCPAGLVPSCPSTGIINDTVSVSSIINPTKYAGFSCGSSAFDITEHVTTKAGRHAFAADIVVNNLFCTPENASLSMHFSPKYVYQSSFPFPASVSGNTVTWNISGVSSINPGHIHVSLTTPGGWLTVGDTIHTNYSLTPTTGDLNSSNNNDNHTDTVNGSWDPNEIAVSPQGIISAGTRLTYTVNFENTGNDTAFNIHIMDTLSDNLDPESLQIVASSAVVNTAKYSAAGHNIIKFDMPNINLLDSSHHNQCDGTVMFSVRTKNGLPYGTRIDNEAGIYFDYNPVVMTNNVENIIGNPTGISTSVLRNNVSVYPNPTSGELTIQAETGAFSEVRVCNIMGQQVLSHEFTGIQANVNMKAFPSGIYFAVLKGDSGVQVVKFEKQ